MPSIIDIQAPQEANAGDTFESLRLVAQQHAARSEASGTAQPRGHAELVALLTATVQRAWGALAVLEHAPAPTTPAGAEVRVRELAARNLSTRMRQRWFEFNEPPRRRTTPALVG